MAPASLLLLAEVMDKTLSLSEHWLWALVIGLAGCGLARWRVWTVAVVSPVALLLAGSLLADLLDPYVGPAIVAEAGRGYVVGSCAAYVVALLLLLAGVALGRRRRETGGDDGAVGVRLSLPASPYRAPTLTPPGRPAWWRSPVWWHVAATIVWLVAGVLPQTGAPVHVMVMAVGTLAALLSPAALAWSLYLVAVGRRRSARVVASHAAIWPVAIVAFLGIKAAIAAEESQRMHAVVAAVERYHRDHGAWPARLADLVPTYLPAIPHARVLTNVCEYRYAVTRDDPRLTQCAVAATRCACYDAQVYSFKRRMWHGW